MSKYIVRKTLLYKTNVEYGDYTINHVLGCSHGCLYPCYAMLLAKRFKNIKTYNEWISPKICSNTLEILDKEIPKFKNKIKSVHLCFTTDPFMYNNNEVSNLSIAVINKLNDAGIKCTVLTKGVLPFDLQLTSKKNEYGITIVSLDEDFRKKMEPYTAPYKKRIQALKRLHDKGFKTWVSIEPYPTPNILDQDLLKILNKVSFVDKIIFGRLNYNKLVSKYKNYKEFYNEQTKIVKDFCKKYNIEWYIKKGTASKKH